MARHKIDPKVSQQAVAAATKALKEAHKDEYLALLDMAYIEQGVESPRNRRERLAAEAAEAAAARRKVREEKAARKALEAKAAEQARIEKALETLREAGIEVPTLPEEGAD